VKYHIEELGREELIKLVRKQQEEIQRLERELKKYKNPNTPPSANQHLKPAYSKTIEVKSHKRGALFDHPGTNRAKKETPNERHVPGTECPGCQSKNFKVIGQKLQQQEEIPPDIQPEAVNIIRDICQCNKCSLKFLARDNQTPLHGKFGINLMVLVIFLRFIVRGVLRKTASFLEASFALKLAPASVQAIIERAAQAGEQESYFLLFFLLFNAFLNPNPPTRTSTPTAAIATPQDGAVKRPNMPWPELLLTA